MTHDALQPSAQTLPGIPERVPQQAVPVSSIRAGRLALLLGVLGFAVAATGSWIPSLWGDEAASIMSAERPWPSLFMMLGHVDAVHGAYYVFLHMWIDAFGASAFSVRLPSAIATGLVAAGLAVIGTRLGGTRLAVLSALVYVVIPRTTYMGGEARGYALSATCAVWLTVLLLHLLRTRTTRWAAWAGYAVLLAASIYVFLYLLMMIIVHGVILLSTTRARTMVRRWLVATAAGVLLIAPVIAFGVAELGQIAFLRHRTAVTFQSFFVGQWFWSAPFAVVAWSFILCASVVFLAGWWRRRRGALADAPRASSPSPGSLLRPFPRIAPPAVAQQTETGAIGRTDAGTTSPSLTVVALTWFALPPAMLLSANLVHASYTSRYMSFVTPAVALMIASGIRVLARRWTAMVAMCLLAGLAAPSYLHQRSPFGMPGGSDWSMVAATIAHDAHPGDAIVFTEGGSPSLNPRSALHLYPKAFAGLDDVTLVTPYTKNEGLWDVTEPISRAGARLAAGDGRIWAVLREKSVAKPPLRQLDDIADLGYRVTKKVRENHDVVYLLTRRTGSAPATAVGDGAQTNSADSQPRG